MRRGVPFFRDVRGRMVLARLLLLLLFVSRVGFGTNIASLQAQRRLAEGSSSLSRTLERLASGARINRASDDAAGLAIASALRVDSRVLSQSIRNVNDAVSYLNIGQSALTSLKEITTRQRELAAQAANGTYSLEQRRAMDREANALVDEYNRIAASATFNGRGIFDTSQGDLVIQAGSRSTLSLSLGGEIASTTGAGTFSDPTALLLGSGAAPTSIVSGDFNGDGNLDIAANNVTTNSLQVRFGNGDGTFAAALSVAGSLYTNLQAADLNGDGDDDIIGAVTGGVGVVLSNGSGGFNAPVTYAVGSSGVFTLIDRVGNGALDIVTAPGGGGTAATAETTIINFSTFVSTPLVITASDPAFTHLVDVMMSSMETGRTLAHSFPAVSEITEITIPDGTSISSGDYFTIDGSTFWFNVDDMGGDPGGGAYEIRISSSNTSDEVAQYVATAFYGNLNYSYPGYGPTITVTASPGARTDASASNPSIGIAITQQGADAYDEYNISYETTYQDQAQDNYSATTYSFSTPNGGHTLYFNGNNPGSGTINVTLGYWDGGVTNSSTYSSNPYGTYGSYSYTSFYSRFNAFSTQSQNAVASAIASALTGAGVSGVSVSGNEVTVGSAGYGDASIYGGQYFDIYSGGTSSPTGYRIWYNYEGAHTDPGGQDNSIEVYVNNGDDAAMIAQKTADAINSAFPAVFTATANGGQLSIVNNATGDQVNGSGYGYSSSINGTALTGNGGVGGINTILGASNGTFSTVTSQYLNPIATRIRAVDLTSDGNEDVVTLSGSTLSTTNDAGVTTTVNLASSPTDFATSDFNGDGHIDFATSDGRIYLSNNGTSFTNTATYSVGGSPDSIAVQDLNGDGRDDLVFGSSSTGSLAILLGNGAGGFSPGSTVSSGGSVSALAFGDFNGDGATDIATADSAGDSGQLLLGVVGEGPRMAYLSLTNRQDALAALTTLDDISARVSRELSAIGAMQSRLSTTLSTLAVRAENVEAAANRITDVDVAQESSELVRTTILQQVGASVLAQANLSNQVALSLLRS